MSELEDALKQVARAVEGMIRVAIREELAAITPDRGQQRPTIQSEWMTHAMVADRLGISRETLYQWRATAKGPPYVKLGRLVRYKTAHVNAWLEQRTIGIPRVDGGATSKRPAVDAPSYGARGRSTSANSRLEKHKWQR